MLEERGYLRPAASQHTDQPSGEGIRPATSAGPSAVISTSIEAADQSHLGLTATEPNTLSTGGRLYIITLNRVNPRTRHCQYVISLKMKCAHYHITLPQLSLKL